MYKREYKGRAVGWDDCNGKPPAGQLLVKDAIADITLQQILTRPDEFDVVATMNFNGDYLSDALAAQVGGIGIAPGANINYITGHAIFEATHGTAPKYADQDKVNPGSVILSGVLMFEHMGWQEVADGIIRGMEKTIGEQDRDLRLRASDDRREAAQVLGVRQGDRGQYVALLTLPVSGGLESLTGAVARMRASPVLFAGVPPAGSLLCSSGVIIHSQYANRRTDPRAKVVRRLHRR